MIQDSIAGLYLASVDDLEHPQKVEFAKDEPSSLAWRPDGTQIAVCTCRDQGCLIQNLWLVEVASLSTQQVYSNLPRCGAISWSPDGSWLAKYAGPSLGSNNVIFYKAGEWKVIREQPSAPILSGSWAGSELFLGEEEFNPGPVRDQFHQLVAISVHDLVRDVLWNPKDIGLMERIKDKFHLEEIAWYMPLQP
jgi:hypothetical protein